MVQRSLEAGATGFISKQSGIEEMIQAVRQVSLGKQFIETELAAVIAMTAHENIGINPLDTLTKREFQIFKMLAESNSTAEIAEKLSISPKTVGVHHTNIMRKLQLSNTTQLVRVAIDNNVI